MGRELNQYLFVHNTAYMNYINLFLIQLTSMNSVNLIAHFMVILFLQVSSKRMTIKVFLSISWNPFLTD